MNAPRGAFIIIFKATLRVNELTNLAGHRDHTDLHVHPPWQSAHLDRLPCGGCGRLEVSAVNFVYLSKLTHIHQENGGFHYAGEVEAGGSQDTLKVAHHFLCFRGDIPFIKCPVRGIKGYLAGDEQQSACLYRLIVWTDRRRRCFGLFIPQM